ncbi:hypothetical protein [Bradyrhizobium sp.]|uniref:hypothetical protein n=1 Tax=Bradyrhizobium sp. TaxID=376 RepID=UPI002630AB05|nr:hypothetical protein [Bradyrhizobium sp.]
MLPGFRFLFAAIMLSMSLLIFGLGAAALLRAAHESFASNSSWRGSPEVAFAQPPETTLPMLATLRVEPATEKPAASAPAAAIPAELSEPAIVAARPEPAPAATEPAKADQVAAARPADAPVEVTTPNSAPVDLPVTQNPLVSEAAPAAPVAEPAAAGETKTAALGTSDAPSGASEPAAIQPEPAPPPPANPTIVTPPAPTASAVAAAPAEPAASAAPATPAAPAMTAETSEAETKIATLGGPPVEVTDNESVLQTREVKLPRARPDESLIRKRLQARRALRRRRLAARARLLLAQQQLQANPFLQQPLAQPQQPYLQPAVTTRQRQ